MSAWNFGGAMEALVYDTFGGACICIENDCLYRLDIV